MRKLIIISAAMLPLLFSCSAEEDRLLERETLFRMQIGKMEDQLYVQQFHGINTLSKTRVFMKDGFFYVSNGESDKVMEFSGFGDLISLYYNEQKNPAPVILSSEVKNERNVTRAAYPYPLSDPGEIVSTASGDLLIDTRIAESRRERDEDSGAMLDRILLRFTEEGSLSSYLGQEGPGGTPFPFINSLHVNSSDEITVVTRTQELWKIFWYTPKGDPLYRADFSSDLLPEVEDVDNAAIETIYPDHDKRIVYLKVDYYKRDEARNIKFSKSMIHAYDLDNENWTLSINLPRNIVKSEQPVIFEKKDHEYLYEFAGVAHGPSFFLLSPYEGTIYRLMVLEADGRVKGRGLIEFSENEIFFRSYYVDPGGILSAIVCDEFGADLVWWRSDIFIEEPKGENSKFLPNEGN